MDSRRFIYLHISINGVNLRIRSRRKDNGHLKESPFFNIFCMIGDFEVTLLKIIAQINSQALGFSKIHSFCSMIRIFDGCSSLEHFAGNEEKTLRIKSTRSENKNSN